MMDLRNVKAATEQVRAIPRPRLVTKIRNTVVGAAFIGGAGYAAVKLSWPWYVVLPVAVFGGFFISQDLTKRAAEFVVALIKDLFAAVKGKPSA